MSTRVGDLAPDFSLHDADGKPVSLADYRDRSNVVLFFYPKDDTPGCTAEACTFRDQYEAFRDAGAEVIGISADTVGSHRGFADRHRLPFPILSDPGGEVRARYGVPKTLGLIPGRMTFVIDRSGRVRHSFSSQFRPAKHVAEAMAILRTLDPA
ncbi:peroxiredoxin [Tundrisphaera sp. TA3]|uniref:peroxiredoxin n=1 Tax=Tundrisphaera sp. TA3 TaxID=3435775 RepID=UPI003EBDCAC2